MTDIYIRREKNSKGCLRGILVLAILLVVGIWGALFIRTRGKADEQEEPAVEAMPLEVETPEVVSAESKLKPRVSGPDLLADARKAREEGDLLAARNKCFEVLDNAQDTRVVSTAQELLGEINIELVMTPRPMPEKVDYTIKSGDTLGALAQKFGTTVELISKGNNIQGSLIRVGDRYRILNGKFSIVVDRSDNVLDLYLNERFFKRYRVGTGKFQKTPTGSFEITDRIAQPTWWKPDGRAVPFGDPENVLGTHWLSLNIRGYGIHGTWEPETIGKQASAGCIRLLNEEIEELYTLVTIGTPVIIKE